MVLQSETFFPFSCNTNRLYLMRIAINTRFLLPGKLEGIGWFTQEVSRRLVSRHPEHEFIFLFDRPYDQAFLYADNIQPEVLFPPARHPLLWWLWFEWAVPAALRRTGADVFLSPDGYASLRSEVPTAMVLHDLAYLHYPEQVPTLVRSYYNYFVPRYLQRAEQVLTVSAYTRNDAVAQYGIDPAKISITCNGCREVFTPLTPEQQTAVRAKYSRGLPYLFYVGAVHPRKNVARLIRAYGQFREQHAEPVLLIIGGRLAWQTGEVEEALRQSAFRSDILLPGYLSDAELPQLLGAAEALVYPSLFEGFGVPLLEAMHAEVPVLTSQVSSMPEVAGEAAILVDPHSEASIAAGMLQLLNDPALRAQLVEAGRQQRQQFSWDRATDAVWEGLLRAAGK